MIVDASAADELLKAYFGTTEIPDIDKMNLSPNGDIQPVTDPNKVKLVTQYGDELVISNLQKTPEYKSKTLMW